MKKRVIRCENLNKSEILYVSAESVRKAREKLRELGLDDTEYYCFPFAKKYLKGEEVIDC